MKHYVLVLAAVVFFASGSMFGIDKLCCPCKGADGKLFFAQTVPSLPNACSTACTSNGGTSTQQSSFTVDQSESCTAPRSTKSKNVGVTQERVVADVKYSVYHQGAVIWTGAGNADSEERLHGEKLRAALTTNIDMDKTYLLAAPIQMLEDATTEAIAQCIAEKNIEADFVWVCGHEHQGGKIHKLFDSGDYNGVRSIFSLTQANDDNLRNRAYCRNNSRIKQLVAAHCPNVN